jgi:hypothetical protein
MQKLTANRQFTITVCSDDLSANELIANNSKDQRLPVAPSCTRLSSAAAHREKHGVRIKNKGDNKHNV